MKNDIWFEDHNNCPNCRRNVIPNENENENENENNNTNNDTNNNV